MRRRLLLVASALYAVGLATLLLWPSGAALNRLVVRLYVVGLYDLGLPPSVTPEHYATLLNVLLPVPLLAGLVVLSRRRAWAWLLGALAVSATVEIVQGAVLDRDGSAADVLANGVGAVLGVLCGQVVRRYAGSRTPRPTRSATNDATSSETTSSDTS